jgi:Zn-dependent M16 (insulinase) family peptidase
LSLVRKYHASYYVPHNLVLVVAGKLIEGTASLLDVVQEHVEPSLIQHNQNKGRNPTGWTRPFVETPSAQRNLIVSTTKSIVEFPEKDESMAFLLGISVAFL